MQVNLAVGSADAIAVCLNALHQRVVRLIECIERSGVCTTRAIVSTAGSSRTYASAAARRGAHRETDLCIHSALAILRVVIKRETGSCHLQALVALGTHPVRATVAVADCTPGSGRGWMRRAAPELFWARFDTSPTDRRSRIIAVFVIVIQTPLLTIFVLRGIRFVHRHYRILHKRRTSVLFL